MSLYVAHTLIIFRLTCSAHIAFFNIVIYSKHIKYITIKMDIFPNLMKHTDKHCTIRDISYLLIIFFLTYS